MCPPVAVDSFALPPEAPSSIVTLLETWRAVARDRRPVEADFSFESMLARHPGLCLVDRFEENGRTDFMIIRAGPGQTAPRGRPSVGEPYSALLPAERFRRTADIYEQVFRTGAPDYRESVSAQYGAPPTAFVRLLLPLYRPPHGSENASVARLLGEWVWRD